MAMVLPHVLIVPIFRVPTCAINTSPSPAGAMDLTNKTAYYSMTPLDNVRFTKRFSVRLTEI